MSSSIKMYDSQSFSIPIESTDKYKALAEVDVIKEKIHEYVNAKLHELNLPNALVNNLTPRLREVVANSVDSFLIKDIQIGDIITIDTLIYEKNKQLILEIRDNGLGFQSRQKGEVFEFDRKKDLSNKCSGHSPNNGGVGQWILGLIEIGKSYEEFGKDYCYKVLFKNGEKEGASVLILFDAKIQADNGVVGFIKKIFNKIYPF